MRTIATTNITEPNVDTSASKINTQQDYTYLVEMLKTNERFANQFLYGSNRKFGMNIAPIRSRIINQIYSTYHVKVEPQVFSTVLYEHLWAEGTWKPLETCPKNAAFFSWLSKVAFRAVLNYLEDNAFIKISRARTVANTRLDLLNKPIVYRDAVIDDMIDDKETKSFLKAVYVERLEKDDIKKHFNLNDESYEMMFRKSEDMLKKSLIEKLHCYADALTDKSQRKILLSYEDCLGLDNITDNYDVNNLIYDVLNINPHDPDAKIKIEEFLYDFSENLSWKSEDKYVWQSRFIKEMSPVKVASTLPNRSRPWVDTRFSRLNQKFYEAISKWWYEKTILAA